MLVDLHNHTFPKSDDSTLDVDTLLSLYKNTMIDAVCLTDHDTFWTPQEAEQLSDRYGFLVLPGVEINTDNGHVLVFGLTEYVFGMHKIDFLANCVSEVGGAMIAAHPYRRRWLKGMDQAFLNYRLKEAKDDPLLEVCDAIEVMNGRGSAEENEFSSRLADITNLARTGGSDAHSPLDIGKCCTEVLTKVESLEDLIQALRNGEVKPMSLYSS